jgi:hypothetical protein
MTVTTEKIADSVAARADAARHLALGKGAKASAKAWAQADKARAKVNKAQAKLAGKAALDKTALKAALAKRTGKLAVKSSAARSAATTAAKVAAMNMPTAWMINRRMDRARGAARSASKEASKQLQQARAMVQERVIPTVVPMATTAMDQASRRFDEFMVTSAPARKEAMRRGMLAAAVLRGAEPVAAAKRRRWPMAIMFIGIGGAIGAAIAWLSQAGKPVQLTPYPIPAEEGDQTVDLTSEDAAHHES